MFISGYRSLGLQSSTLANTYLKHIFLSFPLRLNFPKRDYQWEIRPQHSQCHMFQFVVRKLRTSHSQLLTPVLKCNKSTFRQSYFQRVCQWSNFLSEKNRHYSILRNFQVCKRVASKLRAVPSFNLDRSCSWFIKCFCRICRP